MLAEVEKCYECIDGEEVLMSPTGFHHNTIGGNLYRIIANYLHGKRCKIVFDIFVRLGKRDLYAPDIAVFCQPFKIKSDVIEGIPDFVVEILSPSTRKKDVGTKKNGYEKYGVKEYWIVDPKAETIDVYLLKDGKYELDESYHNYTEDELEFLHEETKAKTKMTLKLSLYDDLEIDIKDIFQL